MDSRRRNRLVTIKAPPVTTDDLGQDTGSWTTVIATRANVRQLSGVESIKAGADTSVVKASIRIGYRTDVTAALRVHLGTTVYRINAVMPDEQRKEFLDLVCEVIV